MRRRATVKRDRNHGEIVAALEAARCGVVDLAAVGAGVPDLLVHGPVHPWEMVLMEVKDELQPPSARKLTPDQKKFHAAWRGRIVVVKNVNEALAAMGIGGA